MAKHFRDETAYTPRHMAMATSLPVVPYDDTLQPAMDTPGRDVIPRSLPSSSPNGPSAPRQPIGMVPAASSVRSTPRPADVPMVTFVDDITPMGKMVQDPLFQRMMEEDRARHEAETRRHAKAVRHEPTPVGSAYGRSSTTSARRGQSRRARQVASLHTATASATGNYSAQAEEHRRHRPVARTLLIGSGVAAFAIACGLFTRSDVSRVVELASNAVSSVEATAADVVSSSDLTSDAVTTPAATVATTAQTTAVTEQADSVVASDVEARLATLSWQDIDCGLPTDGSEVDILDGRLLVMYYTEETAEQTVLRMVNAVAALSSLPDVTVVRDSTTTDGTSVIPATTSPAAITSDTETTLVDVTVVAMGPGGYVVSDCTLPADVDLGDARGLSILPLCSGYAVQGDAYAMSGLMSNGFAQTGGIVPTLVTGDAIRMQMDRTPQPVTTSTDSASTSSTATSGSESAASSSTGTSGRSGYTTYSGSESSSTYYDYGYDYDYDASSYDTSAATGSYQPQHLVEGGTWD